MLEIASSLKKTEELVGRLAVPECDIFISEVGGVGRYSNTLETSSQEKDQNNSQVFCRDKLHTSFIVQRD